MVDADGMSLLPSVDIDGEGRAAIAYIDNREHPVQRLRYAYWTGYAWSVETLLTAEGIWTPTVNTDHGRVTVVYSTYTPWSYILHFTERVGGSWTVRTIAEVTNFDHSVAVLEDGRRAIAFTTVEGGYDGVRLAIENGTGWDVVTVVRPTSYRIDAHSLSLAYWNGTFAVGYLLSYFDSHIDAVVVTGRGRTWTKHVELLGVGGGFPAEWLAFDPSGHLHAALVDWNGTVLQYAGDATGWRLEDIDHGPRAGDLVYFSLAVDSVGNPAVAYFVGSGHRFMYASRDAEGWFYSMVNSDINYGFEAYLAFDRFGFPHIAFLDVGWPQQTYDLWYATARPQNVDLGPQASVGEGVSFQDTVPHSASTGATGPVAPVERVPSSMRKPTLFSGPALQRPWPGPSTSS